MPVSGVKMSSGGNHPASTLLSRTPTSKSDQAISNLNNSVHTHHLDHVIAFQTALSARSLVNRSSPNNSTSSVFDRNRGYACYSIDWENMYASGTQAATSPDASHSTAYDESPSRNSSVSGDPEAWSSRFMGRPSMDTLLNFTSRNSLSLKCELLNRATSLPNLRSQNLDETPILVAPEVFGSIESKHDAVLSSESEMPPQSTEVSYDNKHSSIDDMDVQELMRTYDVVSSLEARIPPAPDALESKDLKAGLKKFRRMPTLARRLFVISRRNNASQRSPLASDV
ncbi:hypothetical protein SCHPADRAFT_923737 [Schizopora paradoxa]|uniref:Uncharacterized protein n=1 Tax=Schizopora paradoxa TaxID=27342 RepID=A0A0H2SU32_9AGAM|nr:hypothetical protein SCHPADRAFT_923737 [Schizopora paradoxa]